MKTTQVPIKGKIVPDKKLGNRVVWNDKVIREMLIEEIEVMIEGMKTDERKTATFGDWVAETYEEKMLVNAVLEEVKNKISKLK